MNEILWEDVWETDEHDDYLVTSVSVRPVKVFRRGVVPGATLESITVQYTSGVKAHSSDDNFFKSEQEAWDHIEEHLRSGISSCQMQITHSKQRIANYKQLLKTLGKKVNKEAEGKKED